MSWDITSPAGTDNLSNGDDEIREFKTDIQTALRANATEGAVAVFPGGDGANPVYEYRGRRGNTAARPAATYAGLYINTQTNEIERSNGTTWEKVGVNFDSGTAMVFYQASAPTGWTAVAVNDKFLRVVTAGGTGGTTGGTVAASQSLAHNHTVTGETLTISQIPDHAHYSRQDNGAAGGAVAYVTFTAASYQAGYRQFSNAYSGGGVFGTPGGSHDHGGATGSAFAGAFAYSDVIIATKD